MTRILLALAMAATTTAAAAAQPPAPAPHPFARQLRALDDVQRRAVLRNAVVSSDQRCGRLAIGLLRGPYRNLDMWEVRCEPGGVFGVFVGPDGSAQVRTCADLARFKLPTCTLPPAPPPRPARRR